MYCLLNPLASLHDVMTASRSTRAIVALHKVEEICFKIAWLTHLTSQIDGPDSSSMNRRTLVEALQI